MSFLILFLLAKRHMNGRDISDEIERRKGGRPSPGTIYPALKSLKEEGLIKEKKKGKIVVYSLTPRGERVLRIAKQRFCRIFIGIYPRRNK